MNNQTKTIISHLALIAVSATAGILADKYLNKGRQPIVMPLLFITAAYSIVIYTDMALWNKMLTIKKPE